MRYPTDGETISPHQGVRNSEKHGVLRWPFLTAGDERNLRGVVATTIYFISVPGEGFGKIGHLKAAPRSEVSDEHSPTLSVDLQAEDLHHLFEPGLEGKQNMMYQFSSLLFINLPYRKLLPSYISQLLYWSLDALQPSFCFLQTRILTPTDWNMGYRQNFRRAACENAAEEAAAEAEIWVARVMGDVCDSL
ncbi:hypothetical protein HYFRA_00005931 [Hymenoscyphus fraxineus]|uniref:Uncharacterized protein n=1 Tax=Hymenoscyphus fraxineus TaxID=746836 RepID=A0A9N9KVL6_9HELO|nr:hypothetical protein HYFRA_00005931 [Hymenoscyphus fraxineus]